MPEALATAGRGPYRTGIKRREQIVESASRVFAEFGYAGGSIRTIAAGVGVAPATLLQHFGSKEGLLEAVLEQWQSQVDAFVPLDQKGLAYLEATRSFISFHLEHRGLIELFLTLSAEATSPSHPAHDFIQDRYARAIGTVAGKMREARDTGEIGPLTDAQIMAEVRLMFAVLDGLELQWLLDADVDLPGLYDAYLSETIRRLKSYRPS